MGVGKGGKGEKGEGGREGGQSVVWGPQRRVSVAFLSPSQIPRQAGWPRSRVEGRG